MFFKRPACLVALTALLSLLPSLSRADSLLNVDIRDLAEFNQQQLPEAAALIAAMKTRPTEFFPQGVTFAEVGVGLGNRSVPCQVNGAGWVKKKRVDAVYGVELTAPPVYNADGTVDLALLALFHSKNQGNTLTFRKLAVRMGGAPLAVTEVRVMDDIPVSRTSFSVKTGLLERRTIVRDEANDITKVYPVGVGGFDEGVVRRDHKTSLLTPLFKNAKLKRNKALLVVNDPDYYCGMPFLRVTTSKNVDTGIAFHIIQHPKMVRGFDSHGCMRLREKDLYELTALLLTQSTTEIPLNVTYRLDSPINHPYPLRDNGYQAVANCLDARWKPSSCFENVDPAKLPRLNGRIGSCKDRHGLTLTRDYACRPPVEKLLDETDPGATALLPEYNEMNQDPEEQVPADSMPQWLEDQLSGDERNA